jgi:hypothetical protein
MKLVEFVKIQDIKRFVDTVFGEKLSFSVDSSETIQKNISRRVEDRAILKSYLASKSSDLIFTVFLSEKETEPEAKYLPDIFGKPDYSKLLRDKFREINKVDIEYWNIEYTFILSREAEANICEINLKFTIRYT